ncbi:Lipoyl synthase, organellar chromatophore [Streptomyces microflavus]
MVAEVFSSRPEVLAHNVETVPRIFKRIRPGFRYERSLEVITRAREAVVVAAPVAVTGEGGEVERGAGRYVRGCAREPSASAAPVPAETTRSAVKETLPGEVRGRGWCRVIGEGTRRRKTPSAQFPAACWSPRASSPYAITMQIDQSMKMAPKRRPSGAIAPGPSSGSPSLLPR